MLGVAHVAMDRGHRFRRSRHRGRCVLWVVCGLFGRRNAGPEHLFVRAFRKRDATLRVREISAISNERRTLDIHLLFGVVGDSICDSIERRAD